MTTDRARVLAIVNMLASSSDGERANAARVLSGYAEAEKKTVGDYLTGILAGGAREHRQQEHRQERRQSRSEGYDHRYDGFGDLPDEDREKLRAFLDSPILTAWERSFVEDVIDRDRALSDRQFDVVQRIAEKIKTYASRQKAW